MNSCALELERRGHDTCVLVPDSKTAHEFHSDGLLVETVFPQHDSIDPRVLEREYDIPSVRWIADTERRKQNVSIAEGVREASKVAASIEYVFADNEFDYVFQARGPELYRLLTFFFAAYHDVTHIWDEFCPFDDGYAFGNELTTNWVTYETIEYADMDEGSVTETDDYIGSFLEEKKQFSYGGSENKKDDTLWQCVDSAATLARTNPVGLLEKFRNRYVSDVYTELNDRLLTTVAESRQLCERNEYVFFPLQYPLESRLSVRSPQYFDQTWLIEYLSRVLPSGVSLFVKQHPNHPEDPSPLKIRRLNRRDGVQFLHPETHAHSAIEDAETVVVINNTVGFETLFFQTPLVVLGDAFYRECPGVIDLNALAELPHTLTETIDRTVDRETAISALHSLRAASFQVTGDIGNETHASNVCDALEAVVSAL